MGGDEADVVIVDFTRRCPKAKAKWKKLYMYTRKGTTCKQVVGNNDKFQSYKPIPLPKDKS